MMKYMLKTFIYLANLSMYLQPHVHYIVNNVEHVCCYILVMDEKYINNFLQPRKYLDILWNMNIFHACRAVKHAFLWLYLLKKHCILERCNMTCLYLHSIYSILCYLLIYLALTSDLYWYLHQHFINSHYIFNAMIINIVNVTTTQT